MDRFLKISLAGSWPAHLLPLKSVGGPGLVHGSGSSGWEPSSNLSRLTDSSGEMAVQPNHGTRTPLKTDLSGPQCLLLITWLPRTGCLGSPCNRNPEKSDGLIGEQENSVLGLHFPPNLYFDLRRLPWFLWASVSSSVRLNDQGSRRLWKSF